MAAIKKVTLQTLSELEGKPRKAADKTVFPPYGKAEDTYAKNFLPVMQFVFNHTSFDPKNELDQKALAALKPLGVDPGKTYHASHHFQIDGQQLARVFGEVAKKELAIWNDPKKAAPLLTKLFQPKGHIELDELVLQSAVGPLGQPADQAMYPGIATTDGKPMNAQHDYVILNAKGGIEVYVAAKQPKGVPAENWLPMTRKDLELDVIMRVYQPDLKKMKTWKAPKAERIE
jgi:hypothetical protein